jgi:hypothetical protein
MPPPPPPTGRGARQRLLQRRPRHPRPPGCGYHHRHWRRCGECGGRDCDAWPGGHQPADAPCGVGGLHRSGPALPCLRGRDPAHAARRVGACTGTWAHFSGCSWLWQRGGQAGALRPRARLTSIGRHASPAPVWLQAT